MAEIGVEHNSTIIAMLPVELLQAAKKVAGLAEPDEPGAPGRVKRVPQKKA
jgi:hypothetical protein